MNTSENKTVILFNPRSMRGIGEDSTPPMALIMASIYIYKKYDVVIVDQRVEKKWQSMMDDLLKNNPICIGITALTGTQIKEGLKVSKIASDKGIPVVWGGVHASLMPEQTLHNPLIDYVVEGEGEHSFAELVEALAVKRSTKDILGIWTKEGGKISFGGTRPFSTLDDFPEIPYHLIDFQRYILPGSFGMTAVLFTSRGCPQRCEFCFNLKFNLSRWRAFSAERVFKDVENLRSKFPQIEHIQFMDDSFFVDLKRARQIAERMMEIDPPITWSVLGAHIRNLSRMDDEYLSFMQKSRLKEVLVGIESGSQRVIDLIRKNFKVEELISVNNRIGQYGIRATYSFVSGFPGETDEDIKETIKVMFQLKKDNPNIVLGNIKPCVSYPGTALYEKAIKLGFKSPGNLEAWNKFVWGNYMNMDIPWVSRQRRWILSCLYYYTILMNPDYMFIRSRLFTVASTILRPIAEWRVKSFNFKFPLEARIMSFVYRFFL